MLPVPTVRNPHVGAGRVALLRYSKLAVAYQELKCSEGRDGIRLIYTTYLLRSLFDLK